MAPSRSTRGLSLTYQTYHATPPAIMTIDRKMAKPPSCAMSTMGSRMPTIWTHG